MTRHVSVAVQPTALLARQVTRQGDCVGSTDPDRWFPPEPVNPGGGSTAYLAAREVYEERALQLCRPCPVRAACLELALREEIKIPRTWIHGIRGGIAPWQRHNLIRNRQRSAMRPERQEVAS
jgi:hypothetical protein